MQMMRTSCATHLHTLCNASAQIVQRPCTKSANHRHKFCTSFHAPRFPITRKPNINCSMAVEEDVEGYHHNDEQGPGRLHAA